jgi:hypothetical protein
MAARLIGFVVSGLLLFSTASQAHAPVEHRKPHSAESRKPHEAPSRHPHAAASHSKARKPPKHQTGLHEKPPKVAKHK